MYKALLCVLSVSVFLLHWEHHLLMNSLSKSFEVSRLLGENQKDYAKKKAGFTVNVRKEVAIKPRPLERTIFIKISTVMCVKVCQQFYLGHFHVKWYYSSASPSTWCCIKAACSPCFPWKLGSYKVFSCEGYNTKYMPHESFASRHFSSSVDEEKN